MVPYATKELSEQTWPDFERLFSQGGGWDFCACMLHQRGCHPAGKEYRTRAAAHVRNLADKKDLVRQGRAHGVLVYSDHEPVGWCQYGPVDELPIAGEGRLDKALRTRLRLDDEGNPRAAPPDWRIPCFVTHKDHRRKGVAGVALGAALESIASKGGGWAEATPIVGSHSDGRYHQIVHTYGRDSAELREFLANWPTRFVRGVGQVPLLRGGFGGVSYSGTVSMFEAYGFEAVDVVGAGYVVMRRHL